MTVGGGGVTVAAGGAVVAACGWGDADGMAGAPVGTRGRGPGEVEAVWRAAAAPVVGSVVMFSGSR